MNLEGNTVLITGGGSGIGRGLAEAFQQRGNTVIIGGRRRAVLEETVAANPGMDFIELDVTSPESIEGARAALTEKYPALNVVINNAGVQRVHDFSAELTSPGGIDEKGIEEEIETNIYGVMRVTAAFLPHLQGKAKAAVVNVTSGLAFVPMARFPVYCATKAFVHSFSMSLRMQLKNTGIRVVELAPPWVKTDLDASHGTPTVHEGMQPMPLDAFIAAAMDELATEKDELPVAGAKYLYGGGTSDKLHQTFEQINH